MKENESSLSVRLKIFNMFLNSHKIRIKEILRSYGACFPAYLFFSTNINAALPLKRKLQRSKIFVANDFVCVLHKLRSSVILYC